MEGDIWGIGDIAEDKLVKGLKHSKFVLIGEKKCEPQWDGSSGKGTCCASLTTKFDSQTHVEVEGECWHHRCVLGPSHACCGTCVHTHYFKKKRVWCVLWKKWVSVGVVTVDRVARNGYNWVRWQLSLISRKDEWQQLWEAQEVRHCKPSIAACRGKTAAQWGNAPSLCVCREPALCQMLCCSSGSCNHSFLSLHASYSLGSGRMRQAAAFWGKVNFFGKLGLGLI